MKRLVQQHIFFVEKIDEYKQKDRFYGNQFLLCADFELPYALTFGSQANIYIFFFAK